MKQVLILTQYSLPEYKRNLNAYQRIYYGSNHAIVHLLIRRRQSVSSEISGRILLHRAPFENRILFFIYAIFFVFRLRFMGCRIILTEPSGFAAVGLFAKILVGYFWVMDVWDTPRRRPGLHLRISDRFVFYLMGFADLYLLSILPQAVKNVRINPKKIVLLDNAIDLTKLANHPPARSIRDPTLHIAFSRSKFYNDMGLDVLLNAAEKLQRIKCPVIIHLVGELTEEHKENIIRSMAASLFLLHGFIPFNPATRAEFFGKMHVGIVPFLACEDLNYTLPIKVLEHLSQGNPVIASRLPGISMSIIHNYNGLLVEPGDPNQLAEMIVLLQRDHELWERFAWNALKSVKKYDVIDKNRKIFNEILNRENQKTI